MKNNRIQFVCLVTALLYTFSFACQAAQSPAEELRSYLRPIKTIKANFAQSVVGSKNKVLQTASGSMEFKQPNLFRWQIEQPDPTLIVTDGKTLWNYDEGLSQVVVQKYDNSDLVTPVSFLFDEVENINKKFTISKIQNSKSPTKCFKLVPKVENSNFVSVEVCFMQDQINELRLADHLSQVSTFRFSQVINNPKIELARFKFTAPAGVDVVGEE